MRVFMTLLQIMAVIALIGGAAFALTSGDPSKAVGPNEAALAKGSGELDGMTFTTVLAPQGKPGEIHLVVYPRLHGPG